MKITIELSEKEIKKLNETIGLNNLDDEGEIEDALHILLKEI